MTFRSVLTVFLLVAAAWVTSARAEVSFLAGGGWTLPRGDSATYVKRGLTGEASLELELGPNLGVALGGGYTAFALEASRLKADRGLPPGDPLNGGTTVIDLTLAPKLYLLNHDIAAFFLLGGGPRWLTRRATAATTGVESERTEQAWGAEAGFGVDADFNGFRIGFTPSYHWINAARGSVEYATFVFYLKL